MDAATTTTLPSQSQKQQQQRKTSRGRQKIEIKKVEKESSRYVTFSKRKNGIFNKATELSTLCGAEISVILFSEHGRVFSCGNPDVDKVLDRYLGVLEAGDDNYSLVESSSSSSSNSSTVTTQTSPQEREYNMSVMRLKELKRAMEVNGQSNNTVNNGEFWWDLPVEVMEKEDLEGYKESLEELRKNVLARIDVMAANDAMNESKIISQFIDQNGGWSSEFFNSDINGTCF